MNIRILDNSIEIEGYVNAIERFSKTLKSPLGEFKERICKGAFQRAIDRNNDIHCLLNHDWSRDLGNTLNGTLKLEENAIGCYARMVSDDKDLIQKAKNGDLVGWSFGFCDREVNVHDENGLMVRDVKDMDLFEVSLLDNSRNPAYDGTLVSVRDEEKIKYYSDTFMDNLEIRDLRTSQDEEDKKIDYSKYEDLIKEIKGEKK